MSPDNTRLSLPFSTPPADTTPSPLQPETPPPEVLEALDADGIRKLLDEENAIKNGLTDSARSHLAAACESGRYMMFLGHLFRENGETRVNWYLAQQDFPTEDAKKAGYELQHLIYRSKKSQTSVVPVNHQEPLQETNDAIPDVGE